MAWTLYYHPRSLPMTSYLLEPGIIELLPLIAFELVGQFEGLCNVCASTINPPPQWRPCGAHLLAGVRDLHALATTSATMCHALPWKQLTFGLSNALGWAAVGTAPLAWIDLSPNLLYVQFIAMTRGIPRHIKPYSHLSVLLDRLRARAPPEPRDDEH